MPTAVGGRPGGLFRLPLDCAGMRYSIAGNTLQSMATMERLRGVLLGTAVGDALGLPAEGMSAEAVRRRWGRLDRYRLLGRTGFVSDDTEQSALVAQALILHPEDAAACAAAFRRSLVGWFWRLPWGVGLATARAALKATLGISPSGVASAGNGAAMRSAVVGVFFRGQGSRRREYAEVLARVTHLDERAVEAAVFVAEVAAGAAQAESGTDRPALVRAAAAGLRQPELAAALALALELAGRDAPVDEAVSILGNGGYCVQTSAFAAFLFAEFGGDARACLSAAASAGGDADTIGAVVGGWLGALHGDRGLPSELVTDLCGGPFGREHLEALAQALAGRTGRAPSYSWPAAMARNLALYPVILGHGFRRLIG